MAISPVHVLHQILDTESLESEIDDYLLRPWTAMERTSGRIWLRDDLPSYMQDALVEKYRMVGWNVSWTGSPEAPPQGLYFLPPRTHGSGPKAKGRKGHTDDKT